jgi:LuxR family quorum-sensing system transcriptional regulator SolR
METWREDQINALLSAKSETDLFNQVAELAVGMGFEYCAYGIQMPVPISRPVVAMFNNYSPAWQERYNSRAYLQVDPTVLHALRSTLPVVWSNGLFAALARRLGKRRFVDARAQRGPTDPGGIAR